MAPISADLAERTVAGVRRFCDSAGVDTDLLTGLAQRVKPVVPWDCGVWFTTDPSTTLFTDAHVDGFAQDTCTPWFHHELNVEDVNLFRDLAGSGRVAVLDRDCEDPVRASARHREVMRPLGLQHEVRLTAEDSSGTWGAVELHREAGPRGFADDELALLGRLAPVMVAGIRRQAVERAALRGADEDGPGLIHVSPEGDVRPGTKAGAHWLTLLVPRDAQTSHSALLSVAAVASAHGSTRLRTRAADGTWVTLHVSPAYDSDDRVIIVEPTTPPDVAELLARAHGLSPREREVALALARGESTESIATALCLSPHTVRDHLKTVFRKTGTSSRTEVVAHLFRGWYADRVLGPGAGHHH